MTAAPPACLLLIVQAQCVLIAGAPSAVTIPQTTEGKP
jgi:hypothetical protein